MTTLRGFTGTCLAALLLSGLTVPLPARAEAATQTNLRVIQMNLCNTGTEKNCYTNGQAMTEAVGLIGSLSPDVVTVAEICQRDVAVLAAALGGTTGYRFQPEWNATAGAPVACTNGDPAGNAVLVAPDHPVLAAIAGRYSTESSPSQSRVYTCVSTGSSAGTFYACATHLALKSSTALAQCRQLLTTVLPEFEGATGVDAPVIVGGDFNLRESGSTAVQGCLPSDEYARTSDGAVQHVIAENPLAAADSEVRSMQYTDHPALVVDLSTPW